ncbi:MAG: TIGR03960 family B12-binding radical SAM protein [Anaerolineae bacterium]|nr:TIGR03960 family B12-binding radical SAM protein [Anaerolineae bacterium]
MIAAYQAWKTEQSRRDDLLLRLSKIWGVYVPAFYQPGYNTDGTIDHIERTREDVPVNVTKRIVSQLPPPPTKQIVPSIDIVHNRLSIEIMRGCSRGCRFCHAGMVNRPVRQRSVEQIIAALDSAYHATGIEEIGLLSLSSSDHTQIKSLVEAINQKYQDDNVNISLPSLRIETFSLDLMDMLQGKRHGGFTLAPEAGTERMRNAINKPISPTQLLDTVSAIFNRGWQTIKLYFMIGQPGETEEDIEGIIALCLDALKLGRTIIGHKAKLHVSIGTLVPKPHTPFQWVATDSIEHISEKQDRIKRALKKSGIKLMLTDPQATMLEAWLSRGDRRIGAVIFAAWKRGAKFDAWQDQYNYQTWLQAFDDRSIDPNHYAHRIRDIDEVLPWDHIDSGVKKKFLVKEYQNSLDGITRQDCSHQCSACGIQSTYLELIDGGEKISWKCPPMVKNRSPHMVG